MKDLSIVQEYALLTLNEKGAFPTWSFPYSAICFVVAALSDLCLNNVAVLDEKNQITSVGTLPEKLNFLMPLHSYLQEKHPLPAKKVVEAYTMGFSNHFDVLFQSVCDDLANQNCVETKEKAGIMGTKHLYFPVEKEAESVIRQIRVEILEDGGFSDETMLLCGILDRGNQLSRYFSKHETSALKEKLTKLRETDASLLAKTMMDALNALIVVIVAGT